MMSINIINHEQSKTYYEKSKDYYTRSLTNYDRWHGSLAKVQGLTGEMSKEQFDMLSDHLAKSGREKRLGLDATFSAPKSVSLAMAISETNKEEIIRLHQAAVDKALETIEMDYLQTRSDGNRFNSRNMAAGEFVHFLNRNNELDLHSHCVIMNETFAEGKMLTQDYGKLMNAQKTIGLIYRQELAKGLQQAGYELEITDKVQGLFELKGYNREIVMEYSTRRQEILAEAEKLGLPNNAKVMQMANFATRKTKDHNADLEKIMEEVKRDLYDNGRINIIRKDGQEHGQSYQQEPAKEHGARTPGRDIAGEAGESSFARPLGAERQNLVPLAERCGLPLLSERGLDAPEKPADMLLPNRAVCRLAKLQSETIRNHYVQRENGRERLKDIDQIAKDTIKELSAEKFAFTVPEARHRIMAAGVLHCISETEAQQAMDRADLIKLGRVEGDSRNVYLTTQENIRREKEIVQRMQEGKQQIKAVSMEESSRLLLEVRREKHLTPNKEQTAAIHHIMTSQDRFLCVQGLAGTGKTYTMNTLREMCEKDGIAIRGVCFTGKAADGLQTESGITSGTIHSFLNKLEKESLPPEEQQPKTEGIKQRWDFSHVQPVADREIWIVDEAGLVDDKLMKQLQKAAVARNAQVVLSGDYDQLPPVGAGTPMKAMIEAGAGTAYLEDIRRQKDIDLLEAVRESVQGNHLKTFDTLQKRGDYLEIQNRQERMQAITDKMTANPLGKYQEQLLLVSTNADRKAYNKQIRAELVTRGELAAGQRFDITVHGPQKDSRERRQFASGDRIIFTANSKQLGVMNGTMATITSINGNNITARTDAGEQVSWSMDKYNSIDHAYAVTNYKAQGMTVQTVVADMSTKGIRQNRNALYVDISRAKEKAVVYTDSKERLEKQTRDFAKKITSKDFEKRILSMERAGVKNNDHYHAPKEKGLETLLEQMKKHTLYVPRTVRQAQEEQGREKELQKQLDQEQAAAQKKEMEHEAPRQPSPTVKPTYHIEHHAAKKTQDMGWSR